MIVYVVALNMDDLSVQHVTERELTVDQDLILYQDNEFLVPPTLNPMSVRGRRKTGGGIEIVYDQSKAYAWKELRRKRAFALTQSDWTQAEDAQATFTEAQRAAWNLYRRDLRELPKSTYDPLLVVWPEAPQKRKI